MSPTSSSSSSSLHADGVFSFDWEHSNLLLYPLLLYPFLLYPFLLYPFLLYPFLLYPFLLYPLLLHPFLLNPRLLSDCRYPLGHELSLPGSRLPQLFNLHRVPSWRVAHDSILQAPTPHVQLHALRETLMQFALPPHPALPSPHHLPTVHRTRRELSASHLTAPCRLEHAKSHRRTAGRRKHVRSRGRRAEK